MTMRDSPAQEGSAAVSHRILLIEDDDVVGSQVAMHLRRAGFEATWIRDGDEALGVSPKPYSLVILDLMLPGAYGLDILKQLRRGSDVPVLVLSARNDTEEKVRTFKMGADDYVTKPFWPEELVARVVARLRRPALQRADSLELGELRIDMAGRRVEVQGAPIELTKSEFEIIAALARRPGAAVSRGVLVESALDPGYESAERSLDVHISRLRKKLGPCAGYVATVWGVGYRLEIPA
jgi:DNA-binding response OmpR family regulator